MIPKKIFSLLLFLFVSPLVFSSPAYADEALGQLEGNWKVKLKVWRGENKNPDFFSGKAKLHWELKKQILVNKIKATSLSLDYEGFGTLAFDENKKAYAATWSDTGTSGISYAEGGYDPEQKVFSLKGKGSEGEYAIEILVEEKNSFRSKFFKSTAKGQKKLAEFIYTRKK